MGVLILASASAVRANLLRAAGVPFGVRPADVDEAHVKASLLAEGLEGGGIATALAELKALRVSAITPQTLVLGCDQVLVFDGKIIDKSADLAAARELLQRLRGKSHNLMTAAVLTRDGVAIWRSLERCTMQMRAFSDSFLDNYLKDEGSNVLGSVGCYHLEGRGAQLFERIQGDYFSVLGLPLLPLLAALRDHGVIAR